MPARRFATSQARPSSPGRSRASVALAGALVLVLLAMTVPALAAVAPAATPTRTADQSLVAPSPQDGSEFGYSLDIDGDTMIVGAFNYKVGGSVFSGAAFVYAWSGTTWVYEDTLTPTGGADGDRFGWAVAVDGNTALIGAPFTQGTPGAQSGMAYVFTRSGTSWSQRETLAVSTPDAEAGDRLGYSVALQGDTALVGADEADDYKGAAYVFVGEGADWDLQEKLTAPGGETDDFFGTSVALDDHTALVSAPWDSVDGKDDVGSVRVFARDGADWTEQSPMLTAPGAPADGKFGYSLALDGTTALVGAFGIDGNRGAAYVFDDDGSGFDITQTLQASDGTSADTFGESVALEGDVAVVGADGGDEAAYVFGHDGSSWTEDEKLLRSGGAPGDGFGWACALAGDTLLVGAPWYTGMSSQGRAFAFEGMLGDYTPIEIAGATRYETAIEASKEAFPNGADTVVIATGENWPDALGGAALAGAYDAPILLTLTSTLPSAVMAEIDRLGATDAIILGGPGAVAPAVETALAGELGATKVRRLGGATRYDTAELIARAVNSEVGANYDGTAFVATGLNFPDALAGSPLSAAGPWPIFLAPATGMTPSTLATMNDIGVTDVLILGGTGVVSQAIEDGLGSGVSGDVTRLAGPTRYETAVEVAMYGVEDAGLRWNGVALATGENFPDALAGGPLQGRARSVMLLTHTAMLTPVTGATLQDEARNIATVRFLGGPGAITQTVRDDVGAILE